MNMKNNDDEEIIPILLIGACLVLLIIKLEWGIPIDWIWVFSPIWIPFVIIIGIGFFTFKGK